MHAGGVGEHSILIVRDLVDKGDDLVDGETRPFLNSPRSLYIRGPLVPFLELQVVYRFLAV